MLSFFMWLASKTLGTHFYFYFINIVLNISSGKPVYLHLIRVLLLMVRSLLIWVKSTNLTSLQSNNLIIILLCIAVHLGLLLMLDSASLRNPLLLILRYKLLLLLSLGGFSLSRFWFFNFWWLLLLNRRWIQSIYNTQFFVNLLSEFF